MGYVSLPEGNSNRNYITGTNPAKRVISCRTRLPAMLLPKTTSKNHTKRPGV